MIAQLLKSIFDGAIIPMMLTQASVAFPPLGIVLGLPIIGPGIRKVVDWCVNWLIDKGIITLKEGLIIQLSDKAKKDYAPQIDLLRELQSKQDELTPEQEAEYAKKLQNVIKNRPGVVNA